MLFYHYYPKADYNYVKEHGLISPHYVLHKLKDNQLYKKMVEKYRDRAIQWDPSLSDRSPSSLSIEEIQSAIIKFRENELGDAFIYAFRFKIPVGLSPKLNWFLESKYCVAFDLDKVEPLISEIHWGKKSKEWYFSISEIAYWLLWSDNQILFSSTPHPGFLFKDGHLPAKYLIYI